VGIIVFTDIGFGVLTAAIMKTSTSLGYNAIVRDEQKA
jgi:hypothetical protein